MFTSSRSIAVSAYRRTCMMNKSMGMMRNISNNSVMLRTTPVVKSTKPCWRKAQSRMMSSESPQAAGRGPITWASLIVVGAVCAGSLVFYNNEKERRMNEAKKKHTRSVGKPLLGGPWTLVDHNGQLVTDASLREGGHTHALLYFLCFFLHFHGIYNLVFALLSNMRAYYVNYVAAATCS